MAQVFPKYNPKAGEVMDKDTYNENFRTVVEEVGGRLNEHNWKAGAISDVEDCSAGYVLRTEHSYKTVNWTTLNSFGQPEANPTGAFKVEQLMEWQAIDDLSTVFTSRGLLLWVMASFQYDGAELLQAGSVNYYSYLEFGVQFAIRINSAVVEESIVGGLERSNDVKGEGYCCDIAPVVLDAVVFVPPGTVSIDIVARMPKNSDFKTSEDYYFEVFNRELIVLEAH
tara:strand:+ start:1350 stop:2027 length:678 start_codon:yes stop_codon:yes gene_type:complete